jgi:hypothetical protein
VPESTMMTFFRSLTPLGVRVIIGIVSAIVIALAAWWLFATLAGGKTAKTEAKLNENLAEAAIESGQDAVETVGRTIEYERHIDYITKENERAFRQAPGASAQIDPNLHRLALDRLCQRPAYREHPDCLQPAAPE